MNVFNVMDLLTFTPPGSVIFNFIIWNTFYNCAFTHLGINSFKLIFNLISATHTSERTLKLGDQISGE